MDKRLIDELDYVDGMVVNKVMAKNESGMVVMMAFDHDTEIGTHAANAIAIVQIIEGTCAFTLDGEEHLLTQGDYLVMKPGTPHSLRAPERFKMLLTKLNA